MRVCTAWLELLVDFHLAVHALNSLLTPSLLTTVRDYLVAFKRRMLAVTRLYFRADQISGFQQSYAAPRFAGLGYCSPSGCCGMTPNWDEGRARSIALHLLQLRPGLK